MLLFLPPEYHEIKIAFICAVWISLMSLPAIWAALSNQHWFFRGAAILAGAVFVLAMRAYDLSLVYFFYSAVVIVTLTLAKRYRWWREKDLPLSSLPWRFSALQYSLKDLFLLVLLSGVLAAIVAGLMRGEFYWPWMILSSASLGMSALVCSLVWLRLGKKHVAIRWIVFLITWAGVVISWGQQNGRGFHVVLSSNYFYFDDRLSVIFDQFDIMPDFLRLSGLLFSIGYGLLVAAFFLLWIWATATTLTAAKQSASNVNRWAARMGLVLFILCLTPDAGIVYWRLAKPLPAIVEEPLPNPNGYDFLVKTGKKLELVNVPDPTSDPPSALAAFVKAHSAELNEIRKGLKMPIRTPLHLSQEAYYKQIYNVVPLRQLSSSLWAESANAAKENRYQAAADSALDCIELGIKTGRGVLESELLVGVAITGIGTYSLKEVRNNLDAQQCREILQKLTELESLREPWEVVMQRHSLWEQTFHAWESRLEIAVQPAPFEEPTIRHKLSILNAFRRENVNIELLKTELALRACKLETGQLPKQLSQLVPEYLPAVSLDPYSAGGLPLIYHLQEDGGFLLYSAWHGGKDNGGRRGTTQDIYRDGEQYDYFLDPLPDTPPVAPPQSGQSSGGAALLN